VDQPDFGAVFASTCLDASAGPAVVTRADFIAPRFEAELAFRLSRRVTVDDLTPEKILASLGEVAVAIEIVDSRVRDWKITITDTVADNASHGAAVLGRFLPLPVSFEPAAVEVELAGGALAALQGDATAVIAPGEAPGPVGAVLWLARTLIALGEELVEGDVVLSGAITPLLKLDGPRRVRASATGLGSIELEVW
jgi:2-keto-4-pentenoate hydratase